MKRAKTNVHTARHQHVRDGQTSGRLRARPYHRPYTAQCLAYLIRRDQEQTFASSTIILKSNGTVNDLWSSQGMYTHITKPVRSCN
ncbi:hypothetical protein E2C01_082492 [Portunus trituberculatus]|uniref:Uncharacterized protein n=1 Tax=Portunus trituberculatus TaxID=210409 RepID=A0A5B7IUR2_PORTR|nr:hypothetical protein [Portunus trituberculatus]